MCMKMKTSYNLSNVTQLFTDSPNHFIEEKLQRNRFDRLKCIIEQNWARNVITIKSIYNKFNTTLQYLQIHWSVDYSFLQVVNNRGEVFIAAVLNQLSLTCPSARSPASLPASSIRHGLSLDSTSPFTTKISIFCNKASLKKNCFQSLYLLLGP